MTEIVNIFKLASEHNSWLSDRQVAIAANVANSDSPGYKSVDIAPFAETLSRAETGLAVTDRRHMGAAAAQRIVSDPESVERDGSAKHSGNSVSIEQELIKAQDVRKSFALNTSVIKAFHAMVLASAKG